MFQINTDLSPVGSSKSPVSTSFISPKDAVAFNLGPNRFNRQSREDQSSSTANIRDDSGMRHNRPESDHPNVNNQTNPTTNESYSIEKYPNTGTRLWQNVTYD